MTQPGFFVCSSIWKVMTVLHNHQVLKIEHKKGVDLMEWRCHSDASGRSKRVPIPGWVLGEDKKMNVVMETAEEQTIQDFINFQNYGSYLW